MAVQDSSIITLPGRNRFRIPIVGTRKNNELSGISKATQEWTISMDELLTGTGTFAGDLTATELFGFTYGTERETNGHSVNELLSSSAVRLSDLVVIIQNNSSAPKLEQAMNGGTCIKAITIKRWGWINDKIEALEQRTFTTCYITRFKQILDYLVLHIRTCERTESIFVFPQNGGTGGRSVSSFSAIKDLPPPPSPSPSPSPGG